MNYTILIADSFPASNGDIDWTPISTLGPTTIFEKSTDEEFVIRAREADVVVVNKINITADVLSKLPKLKCICLLATGYNNIDINACIERGVTVCNAKDYSSESVAQHVFALILHILNNVANHDQSIRHGQWAHSWSYYNHTIESLSGKTMGIYGYGKIGARVADIAKAFGMSVLATKRHPVSITGVEFVDIDQLFSQADIISLHAPLAPETNGIINHVLLKRMKSSAILINTGRGGLINENDLQECLIDKSIRAAGLDVLSQEPPSSSHPLLGLDNCILTPHHAWSSIQSRKKLVDIVAHNISSFINSAPTNVVN